MTWHETSDSDDAVVAIETVAHWVGSDFTTIARALGALQPRRLQVHESDSVREPRTAKRALGAPVDLGEWDVVVTSHLPVVLRHRRGTIEVWRCAIEWQHVHEPKMQLVDEPIAVDSAEATDTDQTKRLLKAIAIQRTKQARRSTVCTWCGISMVKGERFSTYCCYSCASTVKGVQF